MKKIAVAKALKPQGIKGEIKFKSLVNAESSITNFSCFVLDNRPVTISSIRENAGFAYIKFNEISTVQEADLMRNKMLYINKEDSSSTLKEGEYLIEDMVGKTCVFEDGRVLGVVTDIQNYGSADVYYVTKENGKEVLFSYVVGVIIKVEDDKIVLNKKRFDEVSV